MDFDDLEPGSEELFASLWVEGDPESVRTLAIEAVRVWNRLCQLDRLLSGDEKTWLTLDRGDKGDIRVVVDGVLSSARMQAVTYRGLLASIWAQKDGAGGAGGPDGDDLDGLTDDDG